MLAAESPQLIVEMEVVVEFTIDAPERNVWTYYHAPRLARMGLMGYPLCEDSMRIVEGINEYKPAKKRRIPQAQIILDTLAEYGPCRRGVMAMAISRAGGQLGESLTRLILMGHVCVSGEKGQRVYSLSEQGDV